MQTRTQATKTENAPSRAAVIAVRAPLTGSARTPLWVQHLPLQAKLTINQPGDIYEQEADRVAAQVMRMPDPAASGARRCACGGIADETGECPACRAKRIGLQRQSDAAGRVAAPPSVHETLRAPGRPLDGGARAFMESRFGHDFGGVRVHTGSGAAASARAVGAQAYTVGQNGVFGEGRYAPGTDDGKRLIAHELAHVVQQQGHTSHLVQRQLSETQIRQRIAEIEEQLASPGGTPEDVLRLNNERNQLAVELQTLTQRGGTPPTGFALDPQTVARPPGLPLTQGYELAQATDVPAEWTDRIPDGQLVTVSLPQIPATSSGPIVPAPVVALAEMGGQAAAGAEAALLTSRLASPGGLLGSYSPFARPPTAAEQALIRAGRAFHFTPGQNMALIQQSGGSVLLRPSTGIYRNLLTPYAEPSAYAFLGQPNAAQAGANLAGRGSLASQALVVIEGADLPPGTLFRPLDRTIVLPRGYQGPGIVVEPGGQMPMPLRGQGATGGTAAVEGTAAGQLTRFQVLRWGGRFFIVVGIVATGYEIWTAPPAQRTRTAVGATSGFLGGLAAGAAAGLVCGPGALACSVILGLTFGIVGGLAARATAESIYDVATSP